MAQRALVAPVPADALEVEVQEALALCKGDALMALRITLIANAFLEAQIEQLRAEVSSGFAWRKTRRRANGAGEPASS